MTDEYRCRRCGLDWPVPSLARSCERKHAKEEASE